MSSPSSPPLILDVRSRRAERALAHLIVGLALLSPWLFAVPVAAQIALSAISGVLVWTVLYLHGWIGEARRVAQIAWLADGRWFVTSTTAKNVECELGRSSRVGATAVWLDLRACERPKRRYSILLTRADGRDGEVRRLIVRLRLDGAKAFERADPFATAH